MSDAGPAKHESQNDADKSVRVTGRVLFRSYDPYIPVRRTRRRLPPWTQPGATYFITFRLGDSIPANLWRQWEQEREIWLRLNPRPWSSEIDAEYEKRFGRRLEEWLDRGCGECHLRRSDVRAIVQKHLLHFDGERYDLDAFVLMPNHVHVLLIPHDGHPLFDLLQGIKGTSARACNKLLAPDRNHILDGGQFQPARAQRRRVVCLSALYRRQSVQGEFEE